MGINGLPPETINSHEEPSQRTEKRPLSRGLNVINVVLGFKSLGADKCSCRMRAHTPSRLLPVVQPQRQLSPGRTVVLCKTSVG